MRFKTKCPRCKREDEIEAQAPPNVSCGECLWRDVNIVPLICTPIKEKPDAR